MILEALFLICALSAVGLAAMMITQKNPIYSALYLVAVFFPLAVLFMMLHAPFVAVIQILVYAGAILVLFVFVIMMINLGEQDHHLDKSKLIKGLAALAGFAFVMIAFYTLVRTAVAPVSSFEAIPKEFGSTAEIGKLIFSKFVLQFELIGILILVALIGAVVLAKKDLD